jgi:atypical dual specificity phosphatase
MEHAPAFSWIDKPRLAAMAQPNSEEEMRWLREQGIDVLISLTEEPPARRLVDAAGLMLFHVPIPDMTAPTPEEIDRSLSAIDKALEHRLGVAVHCGAGLGRTGTILACYLVRQGTPAIEAIKKIRRLRPGSVETKEQEQAIKEYARQRART